MHDERIWRLRASVSIRAKGSVLSSKGDREMTTKSTTKARLGTLTVLAAAVGLGASVSGCVIQDSSSGNCAPDLLVDWQLVDTSNAAITCAAAGVATVQATVNGTAWSQTCLPNDSFGTIDVPLGGIGSYTISVDAFDAAGAPRETLEQTTDLQIASCGISEVPSPAVLTIASTN
jgi:hypothetical protein